jgi:N-acetylglutamate synthase
VAITIPDLERRAALGWRAPEEERLGDWLLRAAGGFTGRANSALAVGDPGQPLDRAARAVRDWYQARGLPAMIAIPHPAGRPQAVPIDRYLADQGWSVRPGTATVMTAPARQVARAAEAAPAVPVGVEPEPDEAWRCTAASASPPTMTSTTASPRPAEPGSGWTLPPAAGPFIQAVPGR